MVFDDDAPLFNVRVAYGTSQRVNTLHRGEFAILRGRNPVAYATAGLSYDTKFDLKQALDLPYTSEWFSVPPAAPHRQVPKLGTLHPSLVRAVVETDGGTACATHLQRRILDFADERI